MKKKTSNSGFDIKLLKALKQKDESNKSKLNSFDKGILKDLKRQQDIDLKKQDKRTKALIKQRFLAEQKQRDEELMIRKHIDSVIMPRLLQWQQKKSTSSDKTLYKSDSNKTLYKKKTSSSKKKSPKKSLKKVFRIN